MKKKILVKTGYYNLVFTQNLFFANYMPQFV